MEFWASVIFIIVVYLYCTKDERASNNRITPPGYQHDSSQATYDIITKGKNYYYQQHISGKYDVPIKKDNKTIRS